ncbi:hypothetical protein SNE510_31470 [Streptomyces sp. NE5-10]|nr:hypothetical protein SNE510_31470 [Streptomyces sp. NE5-10]
MPVGAQGADEGGPDEAGGPGDGDALAEGGRLHAPILPAPARAVRPVRPRRAARPAAEGPPRGGGGVAEWPS